jgi:hypothetical protein
MSAIDSGASNLAPCLTDMDCSSRRTITPAHPLNCQHRDHLMKDHAPWNALRWPSIRLLPIPL